MVNTALTLTEDQLQRMVGYVRARIEAMEEARSGGWLAERERFEAEWNDDFSHRTWGSAVFAKSNESLNMIGAGVDYVRSRLLDEIFGSKPWFFADPRRPEGREPVLAEQVTRHLRWKLGPDQIDFEGLATDLLTQACKHGECVAKVFYESDEERFERIASILWDARRDAPVLTEDGDFVFEEGRPEVLARVLGAAGPVVVEDEMEWRPGSGTLAVLGAGARDGVLPEGFCWRERIVSDRVVHYSGARAVPLHYKEFYCPLNAPSVEEADFVAHMTSMRLSALCAHLGVSSDRLEKSGMEAGDKLDYLAQALRRIRQESALPKSASGQPRAGEAAEPEVADADPEFRLVEAYFRFDARGDGRPCRVCLMVAFDFDVPVFWDYIANVTPTGGYPFAAVVVNKEPHRWYGRSWFKKYEGFQWLIDKLMNQVLYRNELAANPVKFRRKEAVVQWQDDQPFEMGPDKVFDLNDGYTAEDALQTAAIPDLDEETKFLLELVIANWRVRAGMTGASQGTFGGLPAERTATGVAQVAATATTIFRPQLMEVKRGLEGVLRQLVAYQYAYQDADERFSYPDGELRAVGTLTRECVKGLECEVELTLARSKQSQSLEASKMAVDFFAKFLAVPDAFKGVAAPLFATVYKGLQIDNADDYFQQVAQIAQRAALTNTEEVLAEVLADECEGGLF